ncbi:TetR/AcrR family transcriptional regulator [Sphingomonas colocasiae]|uniref:TetR/AcrR family transcriptional regulator n=1 Tax=Sphingomonas colocasiae TaxID=1848973 RepID=A0ABS7PHJ4_9SPHN|nr:TetR/AcrR family transcriptional regulator [Sphingomonas colocasiae]MBY8820765.1 TetR/AcrR family transcriptional regulator [Sphingomonas colocasiae]
MTNGAGDPPAEIELIAPDDACREILRPRPVDRRVRKTIAALHEAVLDLLPEKPFELITVQDIAARADVSRAAFYAHFADKFALMEHIVSDVFERSLESCMGSAPLDTETSIRRVFEATCLYLSTIFSQCRHARRMLDPLIQARVSERIQRELGGVLATAADAGEGAAANVELTATVLGWSIYGAALGWANGARDIDAAQYVEQTFRITCSGYLGWRADNG